MDYARRNEQITKMLLSGESISFTAKSLHCGKSVVSYWADKLGSRSLPRNPAIALRNAARRENSTAGQTLRAKWAAVRSVIIAEAKQLWPAVRTDPDLIAFLGMYWGEGLKSSSEVGVVNSDPAVIRFCSTQFRKLSSAKLDVIVRVYPQHDRDICSAFWQEILGTRPKLYHKEWKPGRQKLRAKFGTCSIRLNDWRLRLKLLTWFCLWRFEILGVDYQPDPTIPRQHFTGY